VGSTKIITALNLFKNSISKEISSPTPAEIICKFLSIGKILQNVFLPYFDPKLINGKLAFTTFGFLGLRRRHRIEVIIRAIKD
jgi:hypothetical protein